ncbi:uncharacterized protein LOC118182835 [Stegodyphus dumicola]|uniref:uncharacterized protein LOC118182835 n=1 Tax=Stegodyphus dumicola TaxID=202533 RepID=UPI0015B10F83|nr:uncharacterized protein LOC118182835 [Stegodyphus dumicola]
MRANNLYCTCACIHWYYTIVSLVKCSHTPQEKKSIVTGVPTTLKHHLKQVTESTPGRTYQFHMCTEQLTSASNAIIHQRHFLGNNTVLDFVQAHGYEIEHLSVSAKIPKSKSKKSIQMDSSMKPGLRSSVALGKAKGTPFPTKKGQGRRSNRHRSTSSYQLPSSSLNLKRIFETSTSASVTTQRSRRFNDLWVRLDTYGRKMSSISSGPVIESRKVPQQAFQTWYQKSQGPDHFHSAGSRYYITDWLWLTCMLWLFSKFAYSFHQYFPMAALTGIT